MITQAVMDFFRDLIVFWLEGVNNLTTGYDPSTAGAAIGAVGGDAGHFIALFVSGAVWPTVVASWIIWLGVWLGTGLIAIISRRGKAS